MCCLMQTYCLLIPGTVTPWGGISDSWWLRAPLTGSSSTESPENISKDSMTLWLPRCQLCQFIVAVMLQTQASCLLIMLPLWTVLKTYRILLVKMTTCRQGRWLSGTKDLILTSTEGATKIYIIWMTFMLVLGPRILLLMVLMVSNSIQLLQKTKSFQLLFRILREIHILITNLKTLTNTTGSLFWHSKLNLTKCWTTPTTRPIKSSTLISMVPLTCRASCWPQLLPRRDTTTS